MRKSAVVFFILGTISCAFTQDMNLDGTVGPNDLFLLSPSWGAFFNEYRGLDFKGNWQSKIEYLPADNSVVLELTSEGNEPQIYVDHRGIAYVIYVKRTLERAPDNTWVLTPQLAFSSILPGGDYWLNEEILTERRPTIKFFNEYLAPILRELVLIGPENGDGDFYALWTHHSSGFSMIRFNRYGIPMTKEYVASNRQLEDVERFNAILDLDGNIHVAWTECPYCFADPSIRGTTREIRYSKFTPEGDMLFDPPIALGIRPSNSGNAEVFRPIIRRIGLSNLLVMIDQGESNPPLAVSVDGITGTVLGAKPIPGNFVEPDFLETSGGTIAMVGMVFTAGKGRNVFYTMLNSDLTAKVAPVNLSNTVQQSDGASIAIVDNDFYVAWNENSDNYIRLVRLHANGARQGKVAKLTGPGIGFPYRLRMDSDASGRAHIVYADGKGSIPAKLSYEKIRIE